MTEATGTAHVVEHEIRIDAPPETVFRLLTERDEIALDAGERLRAAGRRPRRDRPLGRRMTATVTPSSRPAWWRTRGTGWSSRSAGAPR